MDRIIVYLQYKGGAIWRVKKQSHISISKAPGALIRKNTVRSASLTDKVKAFGFLPIANETVNQITNDKPSNPLLCQQNVEYRNE